VIEGLLEQVDDPLRRRGVRRLMEGVTMKTLVFGAGPLGSLFAARLHEAGHDVSLLARRQRLADLREHGVVLEYAHSGRREVRRVPVVEKLGADDDYDLVIVTMRKNQALQILPALASNRHAHTILFLMNNAAGPDELTAALGTDRVMVGFPSSGGYRDGHVMRVMPVRLASIPLGETGGRVTERTRRVAALLDTMRDKHTQIRTDMDAWLVTHVSALAAHVDPAVRFMPDGSSELPLRWGGLLALGGAAATVAAARLVSKARAPRGRASGPRARIPGQRDGSDLRGASGVRRRGRII
jgi:hypothetical protein